MQNYELGIVTGFGDKGVSELEHKLVKSLADQGLTKSQIIKGAHWYRALEHPETIVGRVQRKIEDIGGKKILCGHSYGGLILLAALMRLNLEKFMDEVMLACLIDAPLSPDVKVVPLKKAHNIFWRHYNNRETIARTAADALSKIENTSNLCTLAAPKDRIVPLRSKKLAGNFREVKLASPDEIQDLRLADETQGLNIELPREYYGHSLPPKVDLYVAIIRKLILEKLLALTD